VAPEISTISEETVQISDSVTAPTFAKRSAETRIVVPDGRTVVIGGLMDDESTETLKKVPLLGDIPGLGKLFQRKTVTTSKTELLIFLTPHVVTGRTAPALAAKAQDKVDFTGLDEVKLRRYLDGAAAEKRSDGTSE
jgi:type II secretory pathway component GspD/PulD (secretin)